jgi:hypothetical protein
LFGGEPGWPCTCRVDGVFHKCVAHYLRSPDQPTDPSISRSMSRFSSTEYSMGNC